MIAKVSRGNDTAGLLRYLLGPGRANEHTHPHLVASWDGEPTALEPVVVNGRPQVRSLAALLDQPLDALPRRPSSTVWHCSLRNAPGDRRLSDAEWAEAARHALDRVGLAPDGDPASCRWVAARHGEDHIHLLVTLARQDGRPARTSNDYRLVGQACQELERRFDLTPTRARDSTAARRPTRAETEKAQRVGRSETTRETLRREVRLASIGATSPETFLDELHRNGLLVKPRYSTQDPTQLTGYAVAWPGDHAPGHQPVWFSGSTLAPDLSLPRLQRQWVEVHQASPGLRHPRQGGPMTQVSWPDAIGALTAVTTTLGASTVGDDARRLVQATAFLLTAIACTVEGSRGGQLRRASTRLSSTLDRIPRGKPPWTAAERRLLALAHLVRVNGPRPAAGEAAQLVSAFRDLLRVLAVADSSWVNSSSRVVIAATLADLDRPNSVLTSTADAARCRRHSSNPHIIESGAHGPKVGRTP